MPAKPKAPKPDDPEQSKRFIEAAREHGITDEDVGRFDETLKRIARPQPETEKPDE
jgi:hypothetical protein